MLVSECILHLKEREIVLVDGKTLWISMGLENDSEQMHRKHPAL